MDTNTLFWSQNENPNIPNTIGIDGEIYSYTPDPKLDKVLINLMDSYWTESFKKGYFSKICKDHDVPDNFILTYNKNKGLLIQSVFQNKDENGRPLTFRLWCREKNITMACEALRKYANLSGKQLRDNEIENILNITKEINEKINAEKGRKEINKKKTFILGLIVSTLIILLIWKSCCLDK